MNSSPAPRALTAQTSALLNRVPEVTVYFWGESRGWTGEAQRHDRVAQAVHGHLDRLQSR